MLSSQKLSLKFLSNLELVLKVRKQSSRENDFIEIELDRQKLTYQDLLQVSYRELEINFDQVEKIRKLPNPLLKKVIPKLWTSSYLRDSVNMLHVRQCALWKLVQVQCALTNLVGKSLCLMGFSDAQVAPIWKSRLVDPQRTSSQSNNLIFCPI
uniref:Uncharacterized protein n=1 Tax=Monodelphis domestica TaxID=13616 RepID=A0A5F8GC15_MONDO